MSECCLWQLAECLVGGSEDSERTLARESVDEPASLQRSDERREIRISDSNVHDRFAGRLWGVARHEHSVYNVDNTVGGIDVSSDHLSAVNQNPATRDSGCDVLALHSFDHLHVCDVFGMHIAAYHVVCQQVDQLRLVLWLEQVGKGTSRESGEGLVGGSEDSERTLARESVDEPASLEGSDDGLSLLNHERPATVSERVGRICSIVQVTLALRRVHCSAASAVIGAKAAASALRDSDVLAH